VKIEPSLVADFSALLALGMLIVWLAHQDRRPPGKELLLILLGAGVALALL